MDIDKKWVEEANRVFSVYPGTPSGGNCIPGEEETWLELAQFFRDDLQWLLSLEHHKFWSHVIYSSEVHPQLVSFLNEFPPNHLRDRLLVKEDIRDIFEEIERLVFLIFLRLSTEEESKSCYFRNLGKILYNNYLFTVPIILDICSIYGTSNGELVRKMICNVIRVAPDFLSDFQEVVPHFFRVLKTVKGKFFVEHLPKLKDRVELKQNEVRDLVLYLHDSVATVQMFLELYPKAWQMFPKTELVTEVASFYSNVLPEMHAGLGKPKEEESFPVSELMENTRVDFLKMVKGMLDHVASASDEIPSRREELVDEYLTLLMDLLPEPPFLVDYNRLYPIECEIGSVTKTCADVDTMKVDHILDGVALAASEARREDEERRLCEEPDVSGVKLDSLVTEVKDILPHLEEGFILECLRCYDYNTERVIAAVLENSVAPDSGEGTSGAGPPGQGREAVAEHAGKHRSKHKTLAELLDDRAEVNEMRERYSRLAYLADDAYDDEYDDTYDENTAVPEKEGDDAGRRPFVVPRVLRAPEEEEEEPPEEATDEEPAEEPPKRDAFVENPEVVRERLAQRRADHPRRDFVGRARGRGQSREVLRNREHKEAHKSVAANHNRKKQASRKMNRGMLPL